MKKIYVIIFVNMIYAQKKGLSSFKATPFNKKRKIKVKAYLFQKKGILNEHTKLLRE